MAFSWGLVPFGGYGYGYGFGGGLQQGYGGGGGLNIGSLLLFGVVAYFAVTALSSYFNNSSSGSDDYGAPSHRLTHSAANLAVDISRPAHYRMCYDLDSTLKIGQSS